MQANYLREISLLKGAARTAWALAENGYYSHRTRPSETFHALKEANPQSALKLMIKIATLIIEKLTITTTSLL